jgi:cellobiose phosphorylase
MAVVGLAHARDREGDGDFLCGLHKDLLPPAASARQGWRRYHGPPYAYSQFRYGPEHQLHGEARGSWLTGTAAWSYYGACQWLLGIRPEYDGLRVDPRVPRRWQGFSVRRRFRGALYEIEVRNPRGAGGGVDRLVVDGRRVEGNVIPPFPGGTHRVLAIAGRRP